MKTRLQKTLFLLLVLFLQRIVNGLLFNPNRQKKELDRLRSPPHPGKTCRLDLTSNPTAIEKQQPKTAGMIPPGERFRNTITGELSVVSHNVLAPSYHCLGYGDDMDAKIEIDRQTRFPMSMELAKRANADILCLQEVEGGSQEPALKKYLEKACGRIPGYDSYILTPLNPNRKGDCVGLCVAWRSSRHNVSNIICKTQLRSSEKHHAERLQNII